MSKKGTLTTSDYLPYEEYKRLVKCLEDDKNYVGAAYCVASFSFALRISDVLKLKWCQILGHDNIVVTEQKTKKTKNIVIGKNTGDQLYSLYCKLGKPDINSFIVSNNGAKAMSKQYINRQLKEWKARYGLEVGNFSSHSFRKAFGRYVYNKMGKTQESLFLLCRIFKHTSPAITMIYLGLRDAEINSIFMSLE